MKLISMTNYVLEQGNIGMEVQSVLRQNSNRANRFANIVNYANFLKQSLTLGMFVPCDDDGNVLEECTEICSCECDKIKLFRKAKEKVLFDGFEITTNNKGEKVILGDYTCLKVFDLGNGTIEDLVKYVQIKLTQTAIKQIGL